MLSSCCAECLGGCRFCPKLKEFELPKRLLKGGDTPKDGVLVCCDCGGVRRRGGKFPNRFELSTLSYPT